MNPYEVLGVSENADEETIKKAYKELVKKYHHDIQHHRRIQAGRQVFKMFVFL